MNSLSSILPEFSSGRGTARHCRVVEGYARRSLFKDMPHHRVHVSEDIGSGNSKRPDTDALKLDVACGVSLRPIAAIVRLSVNLDREAGFAAKEIEDKRSKWMLPAKLEAFGTRSKNAPKQGFRQAHILTQRSGALEVSHRHSCPSTMLRMVPLPEKARGGLYKGPPQ
jgi:hypothetical protein